MRRWFGTTSLAESLVLLLFTTIAGVAAFFHEPWCDEAQAWILARDANLPRLLHQMGYEGSPPLWHFLLEIFTRTGMPYRTMEVVSVVLVVAGMYVWLSKSPLPAPARLLIPFAFYYQYQYAVVSRSYALSTLLAFTAAALWKMRPVPVLPFAVMLALLAQSNMHGCMIAAGVTCAFGWQWVCGVWSNRASGIKTSHIVLGGGLIAASGLIARKLAMPAPDCSSKPAVQLHQGSIIDAITRALDGFSQFSKAIGLTPSWTLSLVLVLAIWIFAARKGSWFYPALASCLLLLYPVGSVNQSFGLIQSVVLLLLVLSWFIAVRRLTCALPFLFTVLAMGFVWSRPWHYGMALTAFLVSVWGAWPTEDTKRESAKLTLAAILAVLVIAQMPGTAKSIYDEIRGPYSGSKATAEFLAPYVGQRHIYCTNFYGEAVLPYFDHNVFDNWNDTFWTWSTKRSVDAKRILNEPLSNNAIVVVPTGGMSSPKPPKSSDASVHLAKHHFHKTHEFCGAQFWMGKVAEYECYDIYQHAR